MSPWSRRQAHRTRGSSFRCCCFFWSLRRDAFAQWQAEGFDFFKARVAALWPEAGNLLAPQTDPAIFAQATYRDVAARPWRKDRALLIGDAAHGTSPQLGQGANLALIDALELSAALAANPQVVATYLGGSSALRD